MPTTKHAPHQNAAANITFKRNDKQITPQAPEQSSRPGVATSVTTKLKKQMSQPGPARCLRTTHRKKFHRQAQQHLQIRTQWTSQSQPANKTASQQQSHECGLPEARRLIPAMLICAAGGRPGMRRTGECPGLGSPWVGLLRKAQRALSVRPAAAESSQRKIIVLKQS